MKISLLSDTRRLGSELNHLLRSERYCDFHFAVAYARLAGVAILEKSLRQFIDGKKEVLGIVGVNQGNTSYQGLKLLSDIMEEGLYLRCGIKPRAVFHPKLYVFNSALADDGLSVPSAAIVGSSNMTHGGLKLNEECDVLLADIQLEEEFLKALGELWSGFFVNNDRFATVRATSPILDYLLERGALVDEKAASGGGNKKANISPVIEAELMSIIKSEAAPKHRFFAMTLSGFDVSARSADPVILIPVGARAADEKFWFWPEFYTQGKKLHGLYVDADVTVDGEAGQETIRIYDYPAKSEFRLKSEAIKRRGREGDMLLVERLDSRVKLILVRKGSSIYDRYLPLLTAKASSKKRYGYFD